MSSSCTEGKWILPIVVVSTGFLLNILSHYIANSWSFLKKRRISTMMVTFIFTLLAIGYLPISKPGTARNATKCYFAEEISNKPTNILLLLITGITILCVYRYRQKDEECGGDEDFVHTFKNSDLPGIDWTIFIMTMVFVLKYVVVDWAIKNQGIRKLKKSGQEFSNQVTNAKKSLLGKNQ